MITLRVVMKTWDENKHEFVDDESDDRGNVKHLQQNQEDTNRTI